MQSHHDKELKAVISFLQELVDLGTLGQGQKESITKEINNLRRAARSHDLAKVQAAIGRVAKTFLRVGKR